MKKVLIVIVSIVLAVGLVVGGVFVYKNETYKKANSALETGSFDEAKEIFEKLSDYKNSAEMMVECDYRKALKVLQDGGYDEAKEMFALLKDYKDSEEQITECDYQKALKVLQDGGYDEAKEMFALLIEYKDSEEQITECDYQKALNMLNDYSLYDEAKSLFETISEYKNSSDMILECDYKKAKMFTDEEKLYEARDLFASLGDYSDSQQNVKDITFIIGKKLFEENSFEKAKAEFVKYETDYVFSFWVKSCDMEIIRDLALAKKYSEVGSKLVKIVNDDDFLLDYYGSGYDVDDFATVYKGNMVQPVNCKQYWAHGGAEIGKIYIFDANVMDVFCYRITDRNEKFYDFIEFYPDGRVIK